MPAGRPTKYDKEKTIELTMQYIKTDFMMDGDVIPTQEGLSEYLGVCTSTIDNWGEQYPEFLGALKALKSKQKKLLVNQGLMGTFQSVITKLMLSSNHGMHEKSELDQNIKSKVTIIDDIGD